MKKKSVLIYGEYSGFSKSLAKGFSELNYKSDVLNFNGDGFKNINTGIKVSNKNRISRVLSLIKLIPKILSFKNILIINPEFLSFGNLGPIFLFLFKLTRKNIILICCGDDVEFIRQGKKGLIENWPFIDIDLKNSTYFIKKRDIFINYLVALSSNKIIPVMYDYYKAWSFSKFNHKLTETIPLACDGEKKNIRTGKKLTIMHGINKVDFKGTKIILKALDKIEKKYKNDVIIITPSRLTLNEYLNIMKDVDIAIDQTKSNSYGMNAIYSMFSGHVILAPANMLFLNNLDIKECPIISINNDEEKIFNELEKLILNKENIKEIKIKTQKYAEKYHSPINIAKKYDKYLL